jgi:anti-sigma regulatory factor (Ser/Thr protein kinase)/nucleoid DNA-binding protein/CheY-like chemotaxis protein
MAEITLAELSKSMGPAGEKAAQVAEALGTAIRAALAAKKDAKLPGLGSLSVAGGNGAGTADVAAEAAFSVGDPASVKAAIDAVRKELLAGKRVKLEGLGVFEIGKDKPEIERQPKGHRLIKPAGAAIKFFPEQPIAGGRVAFSPTDDLKQKLATFRGSSIMLVVPERDFFTKTLEYYFESAGWQIETFTKVNDALQKIESGQAYLVILDALFEDYQKFCYALKVRRETSNTPLILLYPSEKAWTVMPAVSIVGDENLPQPFEFRQLLDTADAEIMRAAEEELIFLQQISIHLPTDEPSIEKVIDTVHKLLESSGLNEEGQVAMSAAFREAVVNAAQHGNKYKRDRKIEVQYLLDNEKITVVVKDQGNGFDHGKFVKSGSTRDAISAARERHQQGRMGGLGIMLMLRCCDRLEYNEKGNQLTLTKALKAAE